MKVIETRPLTAAAFSDFGEVIEVRPQPDRIINQGQCGRHHDLVSINVSDGRPGVSIFDAKPRSLPCRLEMMERHPQGSQAFLPMTGDPFLVVVAHDEGGAPGTPLAFLTKPGQGVNYARQIWHGVLTPLHAPGLFAVVDRIGDGANLQEHWFSEPWTIRAP